MSFEALSLSDELLRAVRAASYETPTPIQNKAIPPALEGRDVLGCAQTGTGKTAAFVLPTLQRLMARVASAPAKGVRPIRMLVLTPTRELAAQIAETVRTLGKFLPLRSTVVFGGVGYEPQDRALRAGVDVLVSTPGRLIDHLSRGVVSLSHVEVLVLDEADQMLDMGFIHDVRRIVAKVPRERQTLFFSATMPPAIRQLSDEWLKDPVEVSVAPPATTAERVAQELYFVETGDKRALLEELVSRSEVTRALVFSRTKHGANKIARWLETAGVKAEPIHGNKSQNARTRALASFKSGTTRVLVATDLAARGLDIDEVSHVINFDLPNVPEVYVHRIGRTARAGNEGVAWSFCNTEEREYLWDIERTTRQKIPVVIDHPWASTVPVVERGARPAGASSARPSNGGGRTGPWALARSRRRWRWTRSVARSRWWRRWRWWRSVDASTRRGRATAARTRWATTIAAATSPATIVAPTRLTVSPAHAMKPAATPPSGDRSTQRVGEHATTTRTPASARRTTAGHGRPRARVGRGRGRVASTGLFCARSRGARSRHPAHARSSHWCGGDGDGGVCGAVEGRGPPRDRQRHRVLSADG